MPFDRLGKVTCVVAVLACVAALMPMLSAHSSIAADPPKIVVPMSFGDRSTITVNAIGNSSYEPDAFKVFIAVSSGTSKPEEAQLKLEAAIERAQVLLTEASLPAATPTSPESSVQSSSLPGNIIMSRDYGLTLDTWKKAQEVQRLLAPIVDVRNTTTEDPVIKRVDAVAQSSKFSADRDGAKALARRHAIESARIEAASTADAAGMKLGLPINISQFTVREFSSPEGGEQGYTAVGEVIYELLAK